MSVLSSELGPLFDALDRDGVIVAPCPVGYVAAASSAAGVDRIFELKGRDRSRPLSVAGTANCEGRLFLEELSQLTVTALSVLRATMGLVGTRRDAATDIPEGVGTANSLAVFVGLGPVLEAVILRQRSVGRSLFVTSANASGTGNAVMASQLPKALRSDAVAALIDDARIPERQRHLRPAPASPMLRLGPRPTLIRQGFQQRVVLDQLASAGIAVTSSGGLLSNERAITPVGRQS